MPSDKEQNDLDWLYRGNPPARTSQSGGNPNLPGPARPSFPFQSAQSRPVDAVEPPDVVPQPAPRRGGTPPPQGPSRRPSGRPYPDQGPSPRAPRSPRARRRRLRIVGLVALVLLVVGGIYLASIPIGAWNKIAKVPDDPGGNRPPEQPGLTFLLVGSDSRGNLTPKEAEAIGVDAETDGARADSTMLLHVPKEGKPVLISLPRDSYLDIPGKGKNKLNASFAFGGPKLMIATVEKATGLRMDGYAEIGFGGFARVVDALGGVDMCLQKELAAESAYEAIPAGCHRLTPKQALWYVRSRHSDATQDLARVQRQRQFIGALMKEGASPATFLNPGKFSKMADGFAQGLAVGEHTDMWDAAKVGLAMGKFSSGGGVSLTVPIADANASTNAGSSVLWDEEQCKELFGQLARGDTTNIERFAEKR